MSYQFVTFRLGDGLFGIDVLIVREIVCNFEIEPVDPAPDFFVGLMNLRGQIVSVVDLGVRMGMERRTITDKSCCIVLKTNKELANLEHRHTGLENTTKDMVGLLVDSISDMVVCDEAEIELPPANAGAVEGRFLSGVVNKDNNLILTLKIKEILQAGAEKSVE